MYAATTRSLFLSIELVDASTLRYYNELNGKTRPKTEEEEC